MSETREGGCLCGAIRFSAHGQPKWVALCHCRSCRRQTGAPVAAFASYEAGHIIFMTGDLATYASSPGVKRGFCATCGSTLTYEGARWPGEVHVHIGAFDTPEMLVPIHEGNTAERLPWLHLDTGMLPSGSDATRTVDV